MNDREQRGLEIAAVTKIKKANSVWLVPSQTGSSTYQVSMDTSTPQCSCPDFGMRGQKCKHIYAVEFTIKRETKPDGTTTVTKTMRVTYKQDWPTYNAAQTHETEHFVKLLRELCDGIPQPAQTFGRPRLPLSDVVFGMAYKVYSTMSGRRIMSELREAESKGLLSKTPSFTSGFRYLENPELTPLLKVLIEQSAMPMKAIESDFAVDSSGFSTTTYDRWFDHKYGKMRSEAKWIKAHLMCGVKTHVVTSVEVTPTETADAPQFGPLVNTTAKTFAINEVSADKAYSSRRNLHAVQAVGGTAYIPFKSYSIGVPKHTNKYDSLWHHTWAYYQYNRQTFLAHYHKRSNVETTYSMIKAKFGGAVRAKTPVAQVNEVLVKILCHNICTLITSIFELGIEAQTGVLTFGTELPVVPEVG